MMLRRILLMMAMLLLLAGCTRASGTPTGTQPPLGQGAVPSPTLALPPGMGLPTPISGNALPTAPAGLVGRFSNLRFSTTGNGEPMTTIPAGTEEVYALWDYDAMQASDQMRRVWYHNDAVEVDRTEQWDQIKYGFTGTVRDVFYYDRTGSGVSAGSWRVEIYLNGELQLNQGFTVGP